MRLVAHDEVPMVVGGRELRPHVLVTGQLIETGDDQVSFEKPVELAGLIKDFIA